jgi:glycosyltransferase involved in cell wall biosynthesis
VTVCLCTRDSPGYARLCLDSLRSQTVGPGGFDIVVVDSASRDDAAAELRRLVAATPNARLLRLERPGLSLARNAGARAATGDYVAFIDDAAAAAPDWVERIKRAVREYDPPPAVLGGRVLPAWEAPLPAWWPASLRGVLTISEWEGGGEYRTAQVPAGLEPYGANMAVERAALLAAGGFDEKLGRQPGLLLSDEDVQLAWKLQRGGRSARHDGRIVVHHRIQAGRLRPEWLLARLYWQGLSTVATRRLLGRPDRVWRKFPRRLAVRLLCAPAAAMVPPGSTRLLALRWHDLGSAGPRAVQPDLGGLDLADEPGQCRPPPDPSWLSWRGASGREDRSQTRRWLPASVRPKTQRPAPRLRHEGLSPAPDGGPFSTRSKSMGTKRSGFYAQDSFRAVVGLGPFQRKYLPGGALSPGQASFGRAEDRSSAGSMPPDRCA